MDIQSIAPSIDIIDYEAALKPYFVKLNVEWIEKYFKVEQHDVETLEMCETFILDRGGHIYFARDTEGVILGTVALEKVGHAAFDVIKMAVAPAAQGRQIGKKLMLHVIEQARVLGAKELFLESNTRLVPAVALYRKVGFVEIPLLDSPFERANIRMLLTL